MSNVTNFPPKKEEPQKHVYEVELYVKDQDTKTVQHYGFLSFGEFVAIIDDNRQPIAAYPYGRVAGIQAMDTAALGVVN